MNRYRHIIFSSLLFFHLAAFGQGREDKDLRLYKIATIYRAIVNDTGYVKVLIDDSEEFLGQATDNGGELKGYYKNDSLKRICEWIGLSTKIIDNDYYLDKGQLIFVIAREYRYMLNDSIQTVDSARIEILSYGKYYFANGKFFDSILRDDEKIKTKKTDAKDFLERTKEYTSLLDERRKIR